MASSDSSPEPPVIVYHKSPFTAALPWLTILIFATLMMSAYIESAPGVFELCSLIGVIIIFSLACIGVLITNEKLGVQICIDLPKSEISVSHRGLRTEFKKDNTVRYQNSDTISITMRQEVVVAKDGTGTATYYEIHLFKVDGPPKLIFSINGFRLSKFKARRIGKKIAHIAKLEYLKKPPKAPLPPPPKHPNEAPPLSEEDEDEPIKFGTILS